MTFFNKINNPAFLLSMAVIILALGMMANQHKAEASTPLEYERPHRPTIVGEVDQGPPLYRFIDDDVSCYVYGQNISCVRR